LVILWILAAFTGDIAEVSTFYGFVDFSALFGRRIAEFIQKAGI